MAAPRLLSGAAAATLIMAQMTASPPSTLLAPGTTSLPLQLSTAQPATCRWDFNNVTFANMNNDFTGAGSQAHSTTLTGLSGTIDATVVFVQCDAYSSGPPLVLAYRALPDSGNAPFPRLGNLWGSGNFRGHPSGLQYAASRASLWLGSDWSADEIAQLRSMNPYTVATTSINACETNDQNLPDEYYLLNITQPASTKGRLQSWPGAWRLDLTNPDVQAYQAQLMYCLVVYGGSGYGSAPTCNNATIPPLIFDGLFIDNFFLDDGAAVNSQDIFHNPFIPLDRATGKPMVNFNERWKDGMLAMALTWRAMMPAAILDGHAMDITDGNITALFNAISIGFTIPEMVEQRLPFQTGFSMYNQWMTAPAHSPKVTMMESAVRLQFGYGYGFDQDIITLISSNCSNSNSVPGAPMPGNGDACQPSKPQPPGYMLPQTFMMARSEYQYFRFGYGFTLMSDGYFAHELGDSWHGQDWDYDEVHFNLGTALGNYTNANVSGPMPPVPPSIPLTEDWSLWVRSPNASNASWALDTLVLPFPGAPASARVDVNNTASEVDGIDLSQTVTAFEDGGYQLSFWARASRDATPLTLDTRKNGGDWHNFGLDTSVTLSASWVQYNITFVSVSDGTAARLSFWTGLAAPNTSVWINSPSLTGMVAPLPVYMRTFQCGSVLLNGDTVSHTIELPANANLQRLTGQQAPMWQYFVDDSSNSFTPVTGQWVVMNYDNGYIMSNPSQEQVRPSNGYYHHWAVGAHQAAAGSSATFYLQIPTAGNYSVAMWWPAAVPARSTWATAMQVSIFPGNVTLQIDLTSQGGDMFFPVASGALLDPTSTLTLECPAGGGDCIADAVLIESAARWNDGSAVANVTLQAMDAIVLKNAAGCTAA